jgi:hypothetical protein
MRGIRDEVLSHRSRKPDPENLRLVWTAYHGCPETFTMEEKIFAIRIRPNSELRGDRRIDRVGKRLFSQGIALPFRTSSDEFFPEIELVRTWESLQTHIRTTRELHSDLIESQMSFSGADLHARSRTGAARVAKELEITDPILLGERSPTIEDIDLLLSRHRAYTEARADAITLMDTVLVKPFAAYGLDPLLVRFARLDALGLLSEHGARVFFASHFLRRCCTQDNMDAELKRKIRRARRKFFAITALPPGRGNLQLFPLKLWLVDNRPVFTCPGFDWTWSEILHEAQSLGIPCTASEKSLVQLASSLHMGITLKRGERPQLAKKKSPPEQLRRLLSPCPVFTGTVFGNSSENPPPVF